MVSVPGSSDTDAVTIMTLFPENVVTRARDNTGFVHIRASQMEVPGMGVYRARTGLSHPAKGGAQARSVEADRRQGRSSKTARSCGKGPAVH